MALKGRAHAHPLELRAMLSFGPLDPSRHPLKAAWLEINPDLVRVAAAFATEAGVDELRTRIATPAPFDVADKQWMIGIQDGVTQPYALRRLGSLAPSEVRVPFGTEVLGSPALRASRFFHPKLYYLENTSTGKARLISTSANLTHSGLRSNVEQFLAWTGQRTDPDAVAFDAWWGDLWGFADLATPAFISSYELLRPKLPTPTHPLAAAPLDSELRAADVFWVELTRKPEGGSFNQVELLFNGHFFFYPHTGTPPSDRPLGLSFEDRTGNVYDDEGRRITFNGPPMMPVGNHMWRVYMPTSAMGFTGYQDGDAIVRFERTAILHRYIVDVAPSQSPEALEWINAAQGIAQHPGPPPRRMGWT